MQNRVWEPPFHQPGLLQIFLDLGIYGLYTVSPRAKSPKRRALIAFLNVVFFSQPIPKQSVRKKPYLFLYQT